MTWADAPREQPTRVTAGETLARDGDKNMTNERKVDDGVIITECHDADEVTAKSGVDAGLDSGLFEAVDERASLPGKRSANSGPYIGFDIQAVDERASLPGKRSANSGPYIGFDIQAVDERASLPGERSANSGPYIGFDIQAVDERASLAGERSANSGPYIGFDIQAVEERESLPVSEPATALMCDVPDVVSNALEVGRVAGSRA